jgi:hypothetical protein
MSILRQVIADLNDPDLCDESLALVRDLGDVEVVFDTAIHHNLHILSTYVVDGVLHVDIGD